MNNMCYTSNYFEICEKISAVYDYIKELYPNVFDNVDFIITEEEYDQTRYSYEFDDETGDVRNSRIILQLEDYDEEKDFQTRYYNSEFGLNLKHDFYTAMLRMLFHECGHHYNIEKFKYNDEEYDSALYELDRYYEFDTDAYSYAYRQIPEERAADEFSAALLKEHLDECLHIIKNTTL